MPGWKQEIIKRLADLKLEPTREAEIVEELAQHLEDRYKELMIGGTTPEESSRAALAELSDNELLARELRRVEQQVTPEPPVLGASARGIMFGDFWLDLRYAVRSLRKHALLSSAVFVTLTLGIGLNTAVFTLINADDLRPPVDKDPDSFLRVHAAYTKDPANPGFPHKLTLQDYLAFRDNARSCDLAGSAQFSAQLGEDDAANVRGWLVTCNSLSVYGVERPMLGRLLQPEDCSAPNPIIILSEDLWRSGFGADPQIVGKVVHLDDQPVTVIGVIAAPFGRKFGVKAWLPYTLATYLKFEELEMADAASVRVTGRLKPGFSRQDVSAELGLIASQQDSLHPGRRTAVTVTDGSWFQEPEHHELARWLIPLIIGTLTLGTLIACMNVITLLLSRASARQQEIAVRLALGAGRMRLIRMLLTETLLLASAAGLTSLYLAYRLPPILYRFMAGQSDGLSLEPDWRVFWYVAGITLLAGGLSGLTPALMSLKFDLSEALNGRQRLFGSNSGRGRLREAMVGAQIAISFLLLAGAGIFLRTYQQAANLDARFETRQVLAAPMQRLIKDQVPAPRSWSGFHRTLAQRIGALPGVQSIAYASALPFDVRERIEVQQAGQPAREVATYAVSPEFFATCGIPVVRGRALTRTDSTAGNAVSHVVVSQELVREFWGGENPLGRTLRTPDGDLLEVVGVARDTRAQRLGEPDKPLIYQPWKPDSRPYVPLVRFVGDPATLSRAIAAACREMVPGASVHTGTIQSWMDGQLDPLWSLEVFVGTLGALVLALAVIGIYGVVSFAVSRRIRELGIRIALGAQKKDILLTVFGYGVRPVVAGLLAGILLALVVSPVVARLFQLARAPFTVDTLNTLAYAGAAVLVAVVALAAMLGPARRATKVDPMVALRYE
jgi:predicted permease